MAKEDFPTAEICGLVGQLISCLGEDRTREGLQDTPERVAKAYSDLFSGYRTKLDDFLTVFDSENYDEMIIVSNIEFYSFCEHHMLPFWGKAHIGYIPKGKIVGLSKLPRLVDMFARRLQNQERLTQQIAQTLAKAIEPKGVGVVVEAQHMCMMARGVQKQGSLAKTSAMNGLFKRDPKTRAEFLRLLDN